MKINHLVFNTEGNSSYLHERMITTGVIQIIKAGLHGDVEKVRAYSKLLANDLRKQGREKEANRVLRAIGDLPLGPQVCLDE